MNKKCNICKLNEDIIASIETEYKCGTPQDVISVKYAVEPNHLAYHFAFCMTDITENELLEELNGHLSVNERYRKLIKEIAAVLQKSKNAVMDKPSSAYLQESYAKLAKVYSSVIKDSENVHNVEDTIDAIILNVINPFLEQILKLITQELDNLKTSLSKKGIPSIQTDDIIVDTFKNLGKNIQQITPNVLENLNNYFGVKKEEDNKPKEIKNTVERTIN